MFGLFSREQEHKIDGREVSIYRDSRGNFKQLMKYILLVCETERVARYFPRIEFLIVDFQKKGLGDQSIALVLTKHLKKGKAVVYLDISNQNRDFKEIKSTIIHELTHIWHEQVSKMSSTSAKIHKRLSKVIANDVSKELKDTRMMLQVFIDKIHYEGIAEFAAKIPSGLEYSKKEFVVNYLMAKDSAKEFNKLWAIFLKTTKINLKRDYQVLSKKFEGNKIPYIIGLHMTHTIKYVFVDVTFQEIAKFSRFKFLKKYEEAMSHGDLKPILTRESNEGIIDYNRILGDLTDLYHKNL